MAEGNMDIQMFYAADREAPIERVSGLFVDKLYHKGA
jgi:hypothetical protein